MSAVQNAEKALATLKSNVEAGKCDQGNQELVNLKILLTQFPSLAPGGSNSASANTEKNIARSAFEWAAQLSIKSDDMSAFERHVTQLKIYYSDFRDLPASNLEFPVLGMYLMHLLVENRLSEFHSELELISDAGREHACVAFPVQLERYLMMGNYAKVLGSRKSVPHPLFGPFMDRLIDTVRDAVADCAEASYEKLSCSAAQQMLLFDSRAELNSFAEDKEEWEMDAAGGSVKFGGNRGSGVGEIPSLRLISECVNYATELERIV